MRPRVMMIGAAAALVVLVIWYVFLWSPRGAELSKAKKRTETAQSLEDQLRTQLTRLKAAQQSEPTKRAQVEALREAIPDQPNLAQFLLDTNDSATKAGIDFLSIAPAQPGAGSAQKPAAIALSISISGGYFQVLDFVNRLLSAPRLVVITGFNVSAAGGATAGQLSAQITATMYTTASKGAASGTTTTTVAGSAGSTTTTVAGAASTTTIAGRP